MRGDGSILDAIRKPDLAAEITLQPVRRYGVDAAILYSDIVVPVAAIGFGVDVAPGTGPGRRASRSATAADLDRLRPLEPERRHALRARDRAQPRRRAGDVPLIGFAGAPFTVASYLIEGRPSRTYAQHQGADARRPDAVGASCSTGWPTWPSPSLRAQVDAGRVGRPALRLLGRRARPGRLRALRAARQPQGVRRPSADLGVPRIHFGVGTGELLGAAWPTAGADVVGVDWRMPLDDGPGRGSGRGVAAAGQPRPRRVPRAVAGGRGRGPRRAAATAATPATSSTSATACCPRPTRRPRARSSSSSTTRGRWWRDRRRRRLVVMAYGTPASPDDVEAYYTHIRRGRPPTPEQLADLGRRYDAIGGRVAAGRAHRGAGGRASQAALDDRAPAVQRRARP